MKTSATAPRPRTYQELRQTSTRTGRPPSSQVASLRAGRQQLAALTKPANSPRDFSKRWIARPSPTAPDLALRLAAKAVEALHAEVNGLGEDSLLAVQAELGPASSQRAAS